MRSAKLAIIISYPTSTSGIIVLLKTPTKYWEFFPIFLLVKTTNFQLVFNFEQMRTVTIFGEHGIMAHIPWWLNQSSKIASSKDSVFSNSKSLITWWHINTRDINNVRTPVKWSPLSRSSNSDFFFYAELLSPACSMWKCSIWHQPRSDGHLC